MTKSYKRRAPALSLKPQKQGPSGQIALPPVAVRSIGAGDRGTRCREGACRFGVSYLGPQVFQVGFNFEALGADVSSWLAQMRSGLRWVRSEATPPGFDIEARLRLKPFRARGSSPNSALRHDPAMFTTTQSRNLRPKLVSSVESCTWSHAAKCP